MAAFAFATAISGIVSLNLCTDELVMLVARPEQIRSVSYLSHAPAESLLWRQARRYRANDGSMLSAAAERPRLVVTMGSGGGDQRRLAAAVGAKLLVLPYPSTLNDVVAGVRIVGQASGNSARAERIVRGMQAVVRSAPPASTDALWIDGAGRTFSANGLGAAWLRLAGLGQRPVPGNKLGLETMITAPPAVLVRSRYRSGQVSTATGWLRHPVARRVRAGRIIETDGRRWTCMGPTLLPEIMRLRGLAGR